MPPLSAKFFGLTATNTLTVGRLPYRVPVVTFVLFMLVAHILSSLAIKGFWHRDNNYGIRTSDYRILTIDAASFSKLPVDRQQYWDLDGSSEKYISVNIKNPFVFWHVSTTLLPILTLALVAFFVSAWEHRAKLTSA